MEQDLADFTIAGYTCSFARLRVVDCLTVNWNYQKLYTQYPMEASKFWNLINLFTTESWSWIAGTIFMVVLTLKISTFAGRKLGLKTRTEEITLVPYRSLILFSSDMYFYSLKSKSLGYNFWPQVKQMMICSRRDSPTISNLPFGPFLVESFCRFLAPTGAQGVTIFVSPTDENLSRVLSLHPLGFKKIN